MNARWEALRKAAQAIRDRAARYQCSDALCCGDPACVAAGHHDEHETTSDGEGWCCGHDECQCIPACSGMAPYVCKELEWMQTTVETLDAALAALEEPAPDKTPMWFPEEDLPINSGWYAVQRQDGSLCLRAFGNDEWWIPLKDGWLSGLPSGFRWMGPLAPIEWDTPRSDNETGRAPRAEEGEEP